MTQLRPQDFEIIKFIINSQLPNAQVWLFGSRAKGNAKPFSDTDLLIDNHSPLTLLEFSQIKEALSESSLPMLVDIVDRQTIKPEFFEQIKEDLVAL